MPRYRDATGFEHGEPPKVGVLLANLGTPDAPTAPALRRYLREFLSDPRVVELPRFKWLPILYLFVLTSRPRKSARLYRKVWTEEGSPLLVMARKQAAALAGRLGREIGDPLAVALGMRYGEPSIRGALAKLDRAGCQRILVLPLYPQYSASTTGSTFDAVAAELTRWRRVPELRTVATYHDEAAYVAALAASVREIWDEGGEPEKLLFSFHGIPQRYFDGGDPYPCQCRKTARLTAERLGIGDDRYIVSFQSLFGREEWIKPYTDRTVKALAESGVRSLDVVCPGFSADCLETLEEIDQLNREIFEEAGGVRFRYVPALNDRPDHLSALARVALSHLAGWVTPAADWDGVSARADGEATRRRAEVLAAHPALEDAGISRP